MTSNFIRLIPGAVTWPCQPHEAASIQIGVPEVQAAKSETKPSGFSDIHAPGPKPKASFREAVLDSSQLTELVEGMGDVLAAAGTLTLRFRVAVEFAESEEATVEVATKLAAAFKKLGVDAG